MYLPVNGKVELVTVSNEKPDKDYIFIEETKYYYRYRPVHSKEISRLDMFVFKVENLDALKSYLSNRTNQAQLQEQYEIDHPIGYYEYITRKLKNFLNYFSL